MSQRLCEIEEAAIVLAVDEISINMVALPDCRYRYASALQLRKDVLQNFILRHFKRRPKFVAKSRAEAIGGEVGRMSARHQSISR